MNKTITVNPETSSVTIEQTAVPQNAPVSLMGNSIQTGYGIWVDIICIALLLLAMYLFKRLIDKLFRKKKVKPAVPQFSKRR